MKMVNTGIELTVIKWTFCFVFGGITLLFAGKLLVLLVLAAKLKIAAFTAWVHSPTAMKDFGSLLWKAVWEGK